MLDLRTWWSLCSILTLLLEQESILLGALLEARGSKTQGWKTPH